MTQAMRHQFTNAASETADRWLDETFYSGLPSLDSHTSFAAGADVPSFLPPSFITRSDDARGLSLDSALDSTSTSVEATCQGDNPLDAGKTIELIWEREDPVSLKLLNRPAAQYLYDGLLRNNISEEEESHHITKTEVEVRQRRDEARIWLALENLDRTCMGRILGAVFYREATRNIDVYTTLEVCYSSALVILRQITQIGKTGALYYFWDTAHLMVAYTAMVLPKLLKLGFQLPIVSMHEALEALHNATAAYSNAAGLLGVAKSPTASPSDSSLEAKTRLLGAILAKLRSEVGFNMDKESRTNRQLSTTSCISIEEPPADKVTTSVYDNDIHLVHEELHMQDGIELTLEIRNEPDFIFDYDFMNSRFIDAGLLLWDEPGIFLQPH
ncbi:Protein priB [Fusarium acutatum]|uniref:Protein priB n=1 Tax=Fusarium acutatum TaxID=78861 RepID=A0A8H4J9R1_9HYPO|nr:Protein priB [Fusarium acutatum]